MSVTSLQGDKTRDTSVLKRFTRDVSNISGKDMLSFPLLINPLHPWDGAGVKLAQVQQVTTGSRGRTRVSVGQNISCMTKHLINEIARR